MAKIFLNSVIGVSCVLLMSCSGHISTANIQVPSESHLVDNHDGTFTDEGNRLQWTNNDVTPGPVSCYAGTEKSYWFTKWHLDCLNRRKYLGHDDWRMPTYQELESLLAAHEIKNGKFLNPQVLERLRHHAYWSTADMALFIYSSGISIYNFRNPQYSYNLSSSYYIWPVRSKSNGNLVASCEIDAFIKIQNGELHWDNMDLNQYR